MATKIRLRRGQPDQTYPIGVDPIRDPDTGEVLPITAGTVLLVADELAGEPPSGTRGEDDWDLGHGLLAQHEKWEKAPKSAKAANAVDDTSTESTDTKGDA
jgi:hypothetical protein